MINLSLCNSKYLCSSVFGAWNGVLGRKHKCNSQKARQKKKAEAEKTLHRGTLQVFDGGLFCWKSYILYIYASKKYVCLKASCVGDVCQSELRVFPSSSDGILSAFIHSLKDWKENY